jgi:hypothetical protein
VTKTIGGGEAVKGIRGEKGTDNGKKCLVAGENKKNSEFRRRETGY